MNKWLIIDAPYLCHRAKYVFGDLSYEGSATGVIYGVLKDVLSFQKRFKTDKVIFCWDSKYSIRKTIYPQYKQNRTHKEYTKEEIAFDLQFREQIKKLRKVYIPLIGWKNNFIQTGYEADDLIASICSHFDDEDEAVIISADQDLFQLIRPFISMFNPQTKKETTLQSFREEYKTVPMGWIHAKAIAGCSSDNIDGIAGVGINTAIKYILGELKPSRKLQAIIDGKKITDRNWDLVCLPLQGTSTFTLQKDKFSKQGWQEVCTLLGMKSLKE